MTCTSMDSQIGLIVQRSRIVLLYNLGIFEVNVCMFKHVEKYILSCSYICNYVLNITLLLFVVSTFLSFTYTLFDVTMSCVCLLSTWTYILFFVVLFCHITQCIPRLAITTKFINYQFINGSCHWQSGQSNQTLYI